MTAFEHSPLSTILKHPFSRAIISGLIAFFAVVLLMMSGAFGAVYGPVGDPTRDETRSSATSGGRSRLAAFGEVYPLACGERPVVDQTNYNVLLYDIYIKLAKADPDYILGRVTCRALITANNTDTIAIDLSADMTIDSVYSPAGPLDTTRVGEVVLIALGTTHNIGDTV